MSKHKVLDETALEELKVLSLWTVSFF